jgi:HEAT repeat protein
MPDADQIREPLLEMLGAVEIDEQVELAVQSWGAVAHELLRQVVRGELEADGYQRASALYLFGRSGTDRTGDDDPDRDDAGDEIARVLERESVPALRLAAIDALRAAGGPSARKALLTTLVESEADISERLHAAEGLADIGALDDLPPLEELELDQEHPALAHRVETAVEAIRYRAGASEDERDVGGPDDPDTDND